MHFAYTIAARNPLGDDQFGIIGFGNAMIAAHGDVAKTCDLAVAATLFLPSIHQRAIAEFQVEFLAASLFDFDIKNHTGRECEQQKS